MSNAATMTTAATERPIISPFMDFFALGTGAAAGSAVMGVAGAVCSTAVYSTCSGTGRLVSMSFMMCSSLNEKSNGSLFDIILHISAKSVV